MKTRVLMVIGATILVLFATAGAGAQGVAFAVFDGWSSDAALHRLNLESGELTPVGGIGFPSTHIAFSAAGALYGIDPVNGQLLQIDVMTGSGSPVGGLGSAIVEVKGLTFDGDGHLWMAAIDDAMGPSLFEIDRDTGAATWIGAIDEAYVGALASSGDTVFTASYALATLDTTTGGATALPGSSLGIWWTVALDFDDHGSLWGLMLCGPCMVPWDVLRTLSIDPATGLIVGDGSSEPSGVFGLAILPGGVFLDGFETGDLNAWQATTPALTINRSLD